MEKKPNRQTVLEYTMRFKTMNSHSLAERINREVNASVSYKTDLEQYSTPEHWCLPTDFGDCEDYALLKRKLLLEQGWPSDKLGLCVCYMPDGQGHCVLWVETDKGSFILDNNYDWPVNPLDLPYVWESMLCNGKWLKLLAWQ